MPRTITVKGIGKVSAKPDYVVLSMSLESRDRDYDRAMETASQHIQHLTDTISAVGFEKKDLKTTGFHVSTEYNNLKDRNGNYHREFKGYVISHNLKLEFDFDMQKLSSALAAIAGCLSYPELSIAFTVKDARLSMRKCSGLQPRTQGEKRKSCVRHPVSDWDSL